VGEENGWLEVIEGEAGRENHEIAPFRDAKGSSRRVRRTIKDQEVVVRRQAERLLDRAEPLDRNGGLDNVLEPPGLAS
jgi:hypothetical protein